MIFFYIHKGKSTKVLVFQTPFLILINLCIKKYLGYYNVVSEYLLKKSVTYNNIIHQLFFYSDASMVKTTMEDLYHDK